MRYFLQFALLLFLLSSCNKYKTKYPYSLKDFNPELRKNLERVVESGGMCTGEKDTSLYTSLLKETSTADLQKLIISEHPLLRAYAFKILCNKKDSSINQILFTHLDDTAIITYCMGEFGPSETTVADYFLEQCRGKTNILKTTLFDTVLISHPYLIHAASFFARELNTEPKYYSALKNIIKNRYQWHYNYRNRLIYELSKYNIKDDTAIIAESMQYKWLNDKSLMFSLIESSPENSYYFTIEKYHNNLLMCKEKGILQQVFQNEPENEITFNNFIAAVAAYKSKKSAVVLWDILNKKMYPRSTTQNKDNVDDLSFKYTLFNAIKKYECVHYKNLIVLIANEANLYKKKFTFSPFESPLDINLGEHNPKYW